MSYLGVNILLNTKQYIKIKYNLSTFDLQLGVHRSNYVNLNRICEYDIFF